MMIECPKCGFVQPQDRYCASCGLDIENFKPTPETFTKRLGKNTRLQVLLAVVLTILITGYLYRAQRVKLLSMQKRIELNNKNAQSPVIPTNTPANSVNHNTDTEAPTSSDSTEGDEFAPSTDEAPTQKEIEYSKVEIIFAEASMTLVQQLEAEAQLLSENGNRRAYLHPPIESISALKERDLDFQILPGGRIREISANSLTISQLNPPRSQLPSGAPVGLDMRMSVNNSNAQSYELGITGGVSIIPEGNQELLTQEFNTNLNVDPANVLILTGFLPRQNLRAEDNAIFSNTPLSIYESPQFINGLTEFVIFIRFR